MRKNRDWGKKLHFWQDRKSIKNVLNDTSNPWMREWVNGPMVNYKFMLLWTLIVIHKASKGNWEISNSKFCDLLSGITDHERSSSERGSGVRFCNAWSRIWASTASSRALLRLRSALRLDWRSAIVASTYAIATTSPGSKTLARAATNFSFWMVREKHGI